MAGEPVPGGRRWWGAAGNVLILVALPILVIGGGLGNRPAGVLPSGQRPALIVGDSVGADLEALALETWEQFLVVFQARSDCFGDVYLQVACALDSRAAYDPDRAMVTIRVPGTAAMLQSSLIHEWAHHVEFQCEAHEELRPAFLAAQGLPPDTVWRPDDLPANLPAGEWAEIPSEQYAEATVELVLDGWPVPSRVRVTREAIHLIEEWAAGD